MLSVGPVRQWAREKIPFFGSSSSHPPTSLPSHAPARMGGRRHTPASSDRLRTPMALRSLPPELTTAAEHE
jgi:hypothetical protein